MSGNIGVDKTGIIILSRLDSSRFPGKALKKILGEPLLGHVVNRMKCVRNSDDIIVATSKRSVDKPIVDYAKTIGVNIFQGDCNNVALRCYEAALEFNLTRFVRICGDSPLIDPHLTEKLIELHKQKNLDVATNVFPRTWPAGNSIEVISIQAMRKLVEKVDSPYDKEHVTSYFHNNANQFSIYNFPIEGLPARDIELTVDHPMDKEKIEWIMTNIQEGINKTSFEKIITLARKFKERNEFNVTEYS